MEKRKIIHRKNLQSMSPILLGAVLFLLLDRFTAAGWVWGVVGTLYLLIVIAWIVDMVRTTQVDIFKESKGDLPRKSYYERLEELKKTIK